MVKGTRIVIIIVNYKTAQLTINCLESIYKNCSGDFTISAVVTDNDSNDGSVNKITGEIEKRGWNSWACVLPLEKNGGFAYGNNRAVEKIFKESQLPRYLWLLNPDTIVKKGACLPLVGFLAKHPKIGIVGSRLENPDGTPQVSAFRDHSIISEFLSGMRLGILDALFAKWLVAIPPVSVNPHQSDWVSGASMMIRREVIEQLGLLDDKFFMYFEDADFCMRAREAGWSCWYVPEGKVIHFVGGASGISDNGKKKSRMPTYWFESRSRYFLKNHGRLTLLLADTLWMFGYSTWKIRRFLQRKPDLDPPHFLKDFFRNSVFCKGFRL